MAATAPLCASTGTNTQDAVGPTAWRQVGMIRCPAQASTLNANNSDSASTATVDLAQSSKGLAQALDRVLHHNTTCRRHAAAEPRALAVQPGLSESS